MDEMNMDEVYIYWDNSNIFHGAQNLAKELNGEEDAHFRLRIEFRNLYRLASADRNVRKALAAGSIPPQMKTLWNVLEGQGVRVKLFDRGGTERSEQDVPDLMLQNAMMRDAVKNRDNPGTVVLLTGDGSGYDEGHGFYTTLEDMHTMGWRVELLSWEHTCHQRMRNWVRDVGVFVALDDYYESITFLEFLPTDIAPMPQLRHRATPLDLSSRATV